MTSLPNVDSAILEQQAKPLYYDSIYFCGNEVADWMGKLIRRGDGPWLLEYRFRYYVDDKIHDSQDRKNWYTAAGPDATAETLAKLRAGVQMLVPLMAARFGKPVDTVELQCRADDYKLIQELQMRQWCHILEVKVKS